MENQDEIIALTITILIILLLFIVLIIKYFFLRKRYMPLIDIENELQKLTDAKNELIQDFEALRSSYKEKRLIFDELIRHVSLYDEEKELIDLGFYKPHFDYDTSERFKTAINDCKQRQKEMVLNKTSIFCNTDWSVDGSKSKGQTMTNRNIRLTSRAFNNECDALISNVRWNNILMFEARLIKAHEAINKMNKSNNIIIDDNYLKLKLEELRLTHEYREKKQLEKEEQAELRRQMREEAKLLEEVEAAEKEEQRYQDLLDKAKEEAEKAVGLKLERLRHDIISLEQELNEAKEKNERAKSMAEFTKSGHVYIISNIGSFGDKVFKIGMTRRLDPMERVHELGDASVPFKFDVHAMIYSKDAPSLENALHKRFNERRLNLVNTRREFFNVELKEIEEEVNNEFPDADFITTVEAREYRESKYIREQREQSIKDNSILNNFPLSL
ncbi:MAG: DUF4041 domain-containing protein [Ignavibacteriales bacterium]|nr:DUF4041 domain-containing protein [Ignavibacteriales bacterium]MCF8435698.1 DUF4041 domain-containing protein [Ignavibacteriales bacterium]